jgi:hypothetical protein
MMIVNIRIKPNFKKVNSQKNEIINNLKNILQQEKKDHKKNILQCNTLLEVFAYSKSHNLESNSFGLLIEYYLLHTKKYNFTKNNSSNCIGDMQKDNINYELKCSLGGKSNNKFNFVQIRPSHKCSHILCAYYLSLDNYKKLGELFVFVINNDNMKELILKFGNYTHGTKKELGPINKNSFNKNIEFAIRPTINGKCWNELLRFRVKHF